MSLLGAWRALPPGGSWGFPLLLPRHPPPQRMCLRAPLGCSLPPLWPPLCPGSYLSPLAPSSLTGYSEVWLAGVFPGGWEAPGPGRACSVPILGRTALLAGTQGALWPAGGWRSSSTRRTEAWMCSLSTWPLPSAPSRKPPAPALTLRHRALVLASLYLAHSSGCVQGCCPEPTLGSRTPAPCVG